MPAYAKLVLINEHLRSGDRLGRGKSRVKPIQPASKQSFCRERSIESFKRQESIVSTGSLSVDETSTDTNFDEILKADGTKKVTLTPTRLRSIEVLKKMQRLQSREATISSSLMLPMPDDFDFDDDFMAPAVKKSETLYEFLRSSGPEDFSPPTPTANVKSPASHTKATFLKNLGSTLKPMFPKPKGAKRNVDVYEFLKNDLSTEKKVHFATIQPRSDPTSKSDQPRLPAAALSPIKAQKSPKNSKISMQRSDSMPEPPSLVPRVSTVAAKEVDPSSFDSLRLRHSMGLSPLTTLSASKPHEETEDHAMGVTHH
ncbi:hypothetical protein K493DRAFT_363711 [Basidiobolus meristosporus CBS 931.73]|uniref:Uncharacterized protein n=1 Tax=Basidiobolus meristosporus CBS 931.73 TaxID=1314790 RepID=A0A1Y1WSC0_9FUNG|nr:hypothetical protein K493DRAFT_363711 [Basidiobolus meristosporus CBS 931.73]|eukprot:ORX76433.1 hypothetical protein K493DRAFT_363711 [Basidiobolus meristosporus CBS 931.73]